MRLTIFVDQGSFLPSAIHRYHQLLMPALQLVDGMLATLGAKHATVSNQVRNSLQHSVSTNPFPNPRFPLQSQRHDRHTTQKRDGTDSSRASRGDAPIVSLCASVLAYVPKSELIGLHFEGSYLYSSTPAPALATLWIRRLFPSRQNALAVGGGWLVFCRRQTRKCSAQVRWR
jgi:nuclear pore complex protein Nup205